MGNCTCGGSFYTDKLCYSCALKARERLENRIELLEEKLDELESSLELVNDRIDLLEKEEESA